MVSPASRVRRVFRDTVASVCKHCMTQLHSVQHHHISLHCRCEHGALINVKSLLENLSPETNVRTVPAKTKWSKCGSKAGKDFRLHWKFL